MKWSEQLKKWESGEILQYLKSSKSFFLNNNYKNIRYRV